MTALATSPVAEPDLLAVVADPWTPRGRTAADRFRAACHAEALAHDGRVDPNGVRERLLVGGVLDIDPRQYAALWSTACAPSGYLTKTDELVPIVGEGSRGNTNKSVRVRRWTGPLDPRCVPVLGKAGHAAGQARRYGPHDPAGAPTTGVVRCGRLASFCDRPGCRSEHDVDLAPALVEQRRRINELAAA